MRHGTLFARHETTSISATPRRTLTGWLSSKSTKGDGALIASVEKGPVP